MKDIKIKFANNKDAILFAIILTTFLILTILSGYIIGYTE